MPYVMGIILNVLFALVKNHNLLFSIIPKKMTNAPQKKSCVKVTSMPNFYNFIFFATEKKERFSTAFFF